MPPKAKGVPKCQVCKVQESKYRCTGCPVRYCSVVCYKKHKEECSAITSSKPTEQDNPTGSTSISTGTSSIQSAKDQKPAPTPLKPLTSLSWPPEPDLSIFTDPLRRDDPKPLTHSELLRISTSQPLRTLLSTTKLPTILTAIDNLPTPGGRSMALSRCLGIDEKSLSQPGKESILGGRDSPPPLEDLLTALADPKGMNSGYKVEGRRLVGGEDGWWLGLGNQKDRVWIGPEERKVMRLWAGIVCRAIDGGEGDVPVWGQGDLAWEV